jgi:hypothetical protein
MLGGSQSWSGRYEEEKNVVTLEGMETQLPCSSPCNLSAIPIELSRLHSYSIHERELTRFIKLITLHFIRILFELLDQS